MPKGGGRRQDISRRQLQQQSSSLLYGGSYGTGGRDALRSQERILEREDPSAWRSMGPNQRQLAARQVYSTHQRAIQMRQQSERSQNDFGSPQNVSLIGGLVRDQARKGARRRRGRASTILTSSQGIQSSNTMLGYKTLLGR